MAVLAIICFTLAPVIVSIIGILFAMMAGALIIIFAVQKQREWLVTGSPVEGILLIEEKQKNGVEKEINRVELASITEIKTTIIHARGFMSHDDKTFQTYLVFRGGRIMLFSSKDRAAADLLAKSIERAISASILSQDPVHQYSKTRYTSIPRPGTPVYKYSGTPV